MVRLKADTTTVVASGFPPPREALRRTRRSSYGHYSRAKAGSRTLCAIACVAFVSLAFAQEGHPLVGTWHGTWGLTAAQRNDVTIVLEYDGKAITGLLNPGPDGIRFDTVTLEPSTWSVHFEATPKAAKTAPIVIDATLQDVTNRHRSLIGTWTQGSVKGDFKISRDD